MVVWRKTSVHLARIELIKRVARVNPSARHAQVRARINIVCGSLRIKRNIYCLFAKLVAEIGADGAQSDLSPAVLGS